MVRRTYLEPILVQIQASTEITPQQSIRLLPHKTISGWGILNSVEMVITEQWEENKDEISLDEQQNENSLDYVRGLVWNSLKDWGHSNWNIVITKMKPLAQI